MVSCKKPSGRPYGFTKTAKAASESPSLKEIHWLAGYLEGEGSFIRRKNVDSSVVVVSSTDHEPLAKCLKYFGGQLYGPYQGKKANHRPYWRWHATGPRAVGIAQTAYPLLSPRRQSQIRAVLEQPSNEQTVRSLTLFKEHANAIS